MSIEFVLTTLAIVATPGTGVLYTIAAGLARGTRASLVATLGCTLGILPHLAAAITGLAALLHASEPAFRILQYLGVAYLLFMAWGALREGGALAVTDQSPPRSAAAVIARGILINLLNPKLTLFFFAFLPQFVRPDEPGGLARMAALSGVFILVTLVVFAVYGICAAAVRRRVLERPRVLAWLRRAFAVSFIALAARLAFAER